MISAQAAETAAADAKAEGAAAQEQLKGQQYVAKEMKDLLQKRQAYVEEVETLQRDAEESLRRANLDLQRASGERDAARLERDALRRDLDAAGGRLRQVDADLSQRLADAERRASANENLVGELRRECTKLEGSLTRAREDARRMDERIRAGGGAAADEINRHMIRSGAAS